jgi:hypothetical protein
VRINPISRLAYDPPNLLKSDLTHSSPHRPDMDAYWSIAVSSAPREHDQRETGPQKALQGILL